MRSMNSRWRRFPFLDYKIIPRCARNLRFPVARVLLVAELPVSGRVLEAGNYRFSGNPWPEPGSWSARVLAGFLKDTLSLLAGR
jgi:hypothetical protein